MRRLRFYSDRAAESPVINVSHLEVARAHKGFHVRYLTASRGISTSVEIPKPSVVTRAFLREWQAFFLRPRARRVHNVLRSKRGGTQSRSHA